MKNKKLRVVDLFSGCGGLSYGFLNAGFEIVLAIDNWKDALDTFVINHPGAIALETDLSNFEPSLLTKTYKINPGEIDVVIGGPPCQGFSISGKRMTDDTRNNLYKSFVKIVKYLKPKAFILENVPNLVSMGNGTIKDQIIEDFEKLGYTVVYKILKASDYGVPQNRRRVIFVGLSGNTAFVFPEPTHGEDMYPNLYVSSKEAIGDLPEESIPDGFPYPTEPESEYQKSMRKKTKGVYNHIITEHTKQTKKIIAMVPDGGSYKNLPKELHLTRKVNIAWTRLNSLKPSFTIDTGHFHHFHYKYNRVPTARESARLQSFPDSFIFTGGKTSQLKQVGNAVPPILANVLAKKLVYYLS